MTNIIIKHKIKMFEEGDQIVLDISDETGGLGLLLYLHPSVASQLGQRMADRARFYAAKAPDDKDRIAVDEFAAD